MIKRRFLYCVLCAVLIVSSSSVGAVTAEMGVGNEKATCYLELAGAIAVAQTTPIYSGNSCQTTVQIYNSKAAEEIKIGTSSISTRWSGKNELYKAHSTHRCGSGYKTLTVWP